MKKAIHPKYYPKAEISCACGSKLVTGSVKEKLHTEYCSQCHPFYTGKQKLMDTAGRVDKFEARRKKTQELKAKAKEEAGTKKKSSRKKGLTEKKA